MNIVVHFSSVRFHVTAKMKTVKCGILYNIYCILAFCLLVTCASHKDAGTYTRYITVINYVERQYKTSADLYKDASDDNFCIAKDYKAKLELPDNTHVKYMEDYKISSVEIRQDSHIILELTSKPFIQKKNFYTM